MFFITAALESSSPMVCILVIFVLIIAKECYRALFGTLSHIPGPFLAKFSSLWIVLQCRFARRSESVLQQHRRHGDIVRIATNHISFASRLALKTIYGHKPGFVKGPFYEAFHQVEPVLFNTRDEKVHQRKKKYLSPAFSAMNLGEYEPHMTEQIGKLMRCFERLVQKSEPAVLDFNEYSNFLAFDVISDYSFGKSFGFLDKERDHLNLIATVDKRGEVLNAIGHLPKVFRPVMKYLIFDQFWPSGLKATSSLTSIGSAAYHERKGQETNRKDLLSFLFKAKDPDTGSALSENEIIAESISFIVGGSDTTSTTMANVVEILSREPEIQGELHDELDSAFVGPLRDDWVADFQTVNRLPILNAVLRETMRYKPTSSTGLERVTPAGGKTISGIYVPEGTLVSVPTLNIHYDPTVFTDPNAFDISQWLGSDSSKHLDSFYPFSLGPRACIGRNFAWMEMLKALATIFRLFKVERASSLATKVREGFFVKNEAYKVRITRR